MALNIDGTTGISGVDGSASAPALQGTDSNTGINFASDTVNINTGGVTRANVDSSGNLNIPNDSGKIQLGTSSDLQIYHNGTHSYLSNGTGNLFVEIPDGQKFQVQHGSETIINGYADGQVELYHDNSKKCSTTSDGIEVHGSTDSARIDFGDAYANSRIGFFGLNRFGIDAHDGLEVRDPSDSYATRLQIDASGDLRVQRVYSNTTSGGANVRVQSDGLMQRDTSSRRYKNTITDATHGLADLNKLRPVTYKGNNDGDTIFGGLIAEEVHDAGLTEFVDYDSDNQPDALKYGNMVSLCIKAIQELSAKVETLETEKTQMQTDLTALTARVTALEAG